MSNNNTSIHDFDFSFICNYFKLLKRQGPGSSEATRKAVSFINELTDDDSFWKGCEGCINHDILVAKNRKFCICTAMLYDPKLHEEDKI